MKRLLLLIFAFAGVAMGQGAQRQNIVFSGSGRPIAGASVFLCVSGSTPVQGANPPCTLANMYSNPNLSGGSLITQPLLTDGLGNYTYFAASGSYVEVIQATTFSYFVTNPLVLACAPNSSSVGCTSSGSGTVNAGNQFLLPIYPNFSPTSLVGPSNLSTDATLNNFFVPGSSSAAGPNPSIDVQSPVYGGRPTNGQVQTTCTTVGGTANVNCASLANFKQGDGVVIYTAGNVPTISTPAAPTVTSPWVTGSVTYNYQCLPLDAADGFPAASSIASVTNAPAVFGNAPVAISNVSWTGSVVTLTFSSTFDANYASYSANTKSVSVVGMGTGLTALNGYWMIASEPSATSLTFALATSGSGTFTGATGRETNTVPGVSVSRSGSTMTVTMAFAEPINVNSYLAPTTVILAGWLPADINGRYAISSNLGDTVSGAVITVHNTPMNYTTPETSTQAGTVTVYEGIYVACQNITSGTVQNEVYGNSNPGGTMQPIGKTAYGQRTFMDYGYWMRNGSSGFYVPPYIPTSPPVAAQNDMYVGKIISITGNSMTVSPNVPSTVTNATTLHDDTTAILAAAAALTGLGNGGSVALTPPNSASCASCAYHTKFPLILPYKVDLELEAPLDSDETIVGSSATNAANGIWKGPNAVEQTTCGQFGQKKCEPLYGHANPIVVFPGGQNFLTGLVLSTNQNGTSNSDDGQILAQFGAGTGAQGAESMSDDYLTTNDATTSTPLVVIGQVSPFQIRDSNFSSSWPNGGPASPGMVNLLPNLGAIWARAGDNSTDNGIMPGAFNFTGNVYFVGKGFLLDSQNWFTEGISTYNLTALNDDQQPLTPFFMDYGGDLPASNVNIANITMDSNTVSLVAQMTSGNGGGNWSFANDTTSGGAPAVTGQVIPALTVRDVTPLIGQNYQVISPIKFVFCGTLAACSSISILEPNTVTGEAALVSGTPSAVTITGIYPAFTSTSTYECYASDQTAPNALQVTKVSGSSITITGPATVTDTVSYSCQGN